MKNVLKVFGIIALVEVIRLSMAACGGGDDTPIIFPVTPPDDGGSGGNTGGTGGGDGGNSGGTSGGNASDGGGNAITGNTIASGAEVVYHSSIKDLAEAQSKTDFGFFNIEKKGIKPLSDVLDGSPSVKVENNKVTIILGTPKFDYLENCTEWFSSDEGITVNPVDAKILTISFNTSDNKYTLLCVKNYSDTNIVAASLAYVDKDVTIKGSTKLAGGDTENFNCSLKKGWNYWIMSRSVNTSTFTSSPTFPSGFKWTVGQ